MIAKREQTLVFCEVKYRKTLSKGHPFEAITKKKRETIIRCALYYLTQKQTQIHDIRFDVIGILNTQIEWIQGAFVFE